jgi:hypothetical protein
VDRYVTAAVVCWTLRAFLAALFVLEHVGLARRLVGSPWWERLLFPPLAGWRAGWKRLSLGWWACLAGWLALGLVPLRWFAGSV